MTQDNPLPSDLPDPDPAPEFCFEDEMKIEFEDQPPNHTPQPQRPPAFTLTFDNPCRHCGYNLRGLNSAGLCPECGTRISISLRRNLLQFAHPAYVCSLASATRIIGCGEMLAIASGCFGVTGGIAVLHLIAGIAVLVGLWRLTAPDPSGNDHPRDHLTPAIARIAQTAGMVLAFIAMLFSLNTYAWSAWFLVAPLVSYTTARIVILFHVGRLSLRIPDYPIAREFRYLRLVFVAALTLLLVRQACTLMFSSAVDSNINAYTIIAITILYLISESWFLILIWRLGTLLYKRFMRNMLEGLAPSELG